MHHAKPEDGVYEGHFVLTVGSVKTAPMSKVYKRIKDGAEDNVAFYAAFLKSSPVAENS